MASGIYIDNLPSDVAEEKLRDMLSQIGDVQSVAIRTEMTAGGPARRGVAVMALDVDAGRAISCFNGLLVGEKKIRLKETGLPDFTASA